MEIRMSFYYDGPIDEKLDKRLTDAAGTIGFEKYGQGVDVETGQRNISFKDVGGYVSEVNP